VNFVTELIVIDSFEQVVVIEVLITNITMAIAISSVFINAYAMASY
jgi:hypothetical protein